MLKSTIHNVYDILGKFVLNSLIINVLDEILWASDSIKKYISTEENEETTRLRSMLLEDSFAQIQHLKTICTQYEDGVRAEMRCFKQSETVFQVVVKKINELEQVCFFIEFRELPPKSNLSRQLLQQENEALRQTNLALSELTQSQQKKLEKLAAENQLLWQKHGKNTEADISVLTAEKHIVKNELQESRKRLELALDAGQLGIWDWNIETGTVVFNPRWAEMLGYHITEIQPHVNAFFELVHPDDVPLMNELVQKHLAGEIPFFEKEVRLKAKNGEYHWIYDRGMVVSRTPKGEPLRAVGIHVYINDHKRTSQALSESEQKLRNIFEYNTIGIIVADTQGNILDVNPKVVEILGYSKAELKGLRPIAFSHPDDLEEERRLAREMFSNGTHFFRMEKRYIRKDKKIIWANFSLTIVRNEKNEFQMALALIEDITEKKEAEEKLKQQNEVLLKVNEELNNFVYRTSHDLRAPLTSLMGLVQIIKIANSEQEQLRYLDMMSQQLNYLDGVIKEIIDYRKVAAGEIEIKQIALYEKIKSVMEHYQFLPQYDSITKNITVTEDFPFFSDEIKLNIIFNNLLSNAIKYSDKKKDNPFISIVIQTDRNGLTMEIRDNGIGIPAQYLDSIFKMFFRASTQQNGTGLGLYIVKEALDKVKGSISVESQEGEGTCFKINIPNAINEK